MILWISGPYGVGKSTLAEALCPRLENPLLFDAEAVGNAVRDNYPESLYHPIFEDYPLWHEFCYRLLGDIHGQTGATVLVPMTLLRARSYPALIGRLRADGIPTELIILEGSYETVHDRILSRGEEEGCWCMEHIEQARAGSASLPGHHIPTDSRSVEELTEEVLKLLGT